MNKIINGQDIIVINGQDIINALRVLYDFELDNEYASITTHRALNHGAYTSYQWWMIDKDTISLDFMGEEIKMSSQELLDNWDADYSKGMGWGVDSSYCDITVLDDGESWTGGVSATHYAIHPAILEDIAGGCADLSSFSDQPLLLSEVASLGSNGFSNSEMTTILELAQRALNDADMFDEMADALDLADSEMKRIQVKIQAATS